MKVTFMGFTKVAIPVLLVILGVNGMLQVHLQKDMAEKSVRLSQQVGEAKALSGQLNTGLSGLATLASETAQMQTTLTSVQTAVSNMAHGLGTLSQTVSGINTSVEAVGAGVSSSNTDVAAIENSERQILTTLNQIGTTSSTIVGHLTSMVRDEGQINQDLTEMNRKTALIP